jgi:hypothetical protein
MRTYRCISIFLLPHEAGERRGGNEDAKQQHGRSHAAAYGHQLHRHLIFLKKSLVTALSTPTASPPDVCVCVCVCMRVRVHACELGEIPLTVVVAPVFVRPVLCYF